MKRFVLGAVVTLGGFGVASACGEPYEGVIPTTPAPDRDATTAEDAGPDAPPATNDAASDARVEAGEGGNACDKDDDGFLAVACDGGDCDDDDERANPDAGFVVEPTNSATAGDWNCDGKITKQYPINVQCNGLLGSCGASEGFEGDPPCGTAGSYVFCKLDGLACVVDTAKSGKRAQGCK